MLLLYLVLLLASHLVRFLAGNESHPRPNQVTATLRAVKHDQLLNRTIELAYRDLRPEAVENPPVVLLLHGSPMASETFNSFAPLLAGSCRVIVPDLPGFRGSTLKIPDYSIRAHAHYLLQLLDTLRVDRIHVVGYSMGGGVALELAGLAPARVQSLTLLSSIGVQELELLGDYHLNRAIHGVQLVLLWLLQEGTPHFGYLDDAWLNVSYARNFYDTDQRPLRAILQKYEGPALIVHGKNDGLVPLATAREHERLLPQSALQLYDGGHELAFTQAELLAPAIVTFIKKVEASEGQTRSQAAPARVVAANKPFDPAQIPPAQGIALFVLMLMLALATLVSEDLTCVSAGLLVARGTITYLPATLACLFGIFAGDILLFLAGKSLRHAVLTRAPFKWFIKQDDLIKGEKWIEQEGAKVIFLSRFLPGSRLPTYLAAGVLGASLWKFSLIFLVAAALWTPVLVWLASLWGSQMMHWLELYRNYALVTLFVLALAFWLLIKLIMPLFSFRGRRLLLSAWRRKTRWEFWPLWMFYPPVALYILFLAIKHRSLTLFTAANPGIFASGFIGESKSDILKNLENAGELMACFAMIDGETSTARRRQVFEFMQAQQLTFPIVLKPDVGQRGTGVAVIRTEAELQSQLANMNGRFIAQEYAPGYEFGVFYFRYPDREKGGIYSITDKRFPHVTGDGKSTLEELILKDERAVCLAPFYLNKHRERLFEVPAAGEQVQLVEIGTHCRGAMFLNGDWVKTPELAEAIDRVSKTFSGFYFGRYDIRTPCIEDFKQGRNFKVVELNGVTSEATSIYDPRNSLLAAYRTLIRQWRIAFEIAAQNVARGGKPVPIGKLLRLLVEYKAAQS